MTRRTERLGGLLRAELSDLIRREMKDPRLSGLISVTAVDVAPDLSHARVFISVLGTDEERTAAMTALDSARVFLRRELMRRVTIRRVPDLSFERDDSLERGSRLLSLIREATGDTPKPGE